MQKLYFAPAPTSPEIYFSPEEAIFFMRGVSYPEDVRGIYYPVTEWFRNYINSLIDGTPHNYSAEAPMKLQIDLAYFNSSSAKFLYDIFLDLKRLSTFEIPFIVEWIYEEEDIDLKEAGSDIASLLEMEFIYVAKSM